MNFRYSITVQFPNSLKVQKKKFSDTCFVKKNVLNCLDNRYFFVKNPDTSAPNTQKIGFQTISVLFSRICVPQFTLSIIRQWSKRLNVAYILDTQLIPCTKFSFGPKINLQSKILVLFFKLGNCVLLPSVSFFQWRQKTTKKMSTLK